MTVNQTHQKRNSGIEIYFHLQIQNGSSLSPYSIIAKQQCLQNKELLNYQTAFSFELN